LTVRPSPADRRVSSVGRNVFASTKNGIAIITAITITTNAARIFAQSFIVRSKWQILDHSEADARPLDPETTARTLYTGKESNDPAIQGKIACTNRNLNKASSIFAA